MTILVTTSDCDGGVTDCFCEPDIVPVLKKLYFNLRDGNLYNDERQSKINANSAEGV